MGEDIWLDPNHDEAVAGASTLVLACMPALNVVTNVWQNGTMSPQQGLQVSFKKSRRQFPHVPRDSAWQLARNGVQRYIQSLASRLFRTSRQNRL